MKLFKALERIARRPEPFEYYASPQLWNDPHISKGMLDAHLDPGNDAASFRKAFIDKSVNWLTARFSIAGATSICDFGCGPGLWTSRFAERGAKVTGVDLSERSLRYAQNRAIEKNLAIRYVLQDYLQFATDDRFDLITMIAGDLSVLSPEQRNGLLQTFFTLLAEEGALVLDVASMARFHEASEKTAHEFYPTGGFWAPGPHHVFSRCFKYEPEHLLCDKYTIVERDRAMELCIWNQCYSVASLKEAFDENGLQIVECFSDVAGTPLTDEAQVIAAVAMKSA